MEIYKLFFHKIISAIINILSQFISTFPLSCIQYPQQIHFLWLQIKQNLRCTWSFWTSFNWYLCSKAASPLWVSVLNKLSTSKWVTLFINRTSKFNISTILHFFKHFLFYWSTSHLNSFPCKILIQIGKTPFIFLKQYHN